MVVETKYVTVDREELRELREESAELARLRASANSDPVVQVSPEVSNRISRRGREAIMAATNSEDGREVPNIAAEMYEIAERILDIAEGRPKAVSTTLMAPVRDYRLKDAKAMARVMGDRLVALADSCTQHSRIVAAKDAEIARMNAGLRIEAEEKHEALMELRAQPARQVGGDERARKADLLDQYTNEAEAAGFAGVGEWLDALQESLRLVTLARDAFDKKLTEWQQIAETEAENRMAERAALAPAAVVMPERDDYHQIAFEIGGTEDGAYHFEADELDAFVARLNRRAIPGELLEQLSGEECVIRHVDDHYHIDGWRCVHCLEDGKTFKEFKHAKDCPTVELRALLGKEEK